MLDTNTLTTKALLKQSSDYTCIILVPSKWSSVPVRSLETEALQTLSIFLSWEMSSFLYSQKTFTLCQPWKIKPHKTCSKLDTQSTQTLSTEELGELKPCEAAGTQNTDPLLSFPLSDDSKTLWTITIFSRTLEPNPYDLLALPELRKLFLWNLTRPEVNSYW